MANRRLYIIGAGMGACSQITGQGLEILKKSEVIYAFDRIAQLYGEEFPHIISCDYKGLMEYLNTETSDCISILVSGDVGFFSIAKTIGTKFLDVFEIETICGINSMQYLCSKVGVSYENLHVLSLHGRDAISKLLGTIGYEEYSFLLTGGKNTTSVILSYLQEIGNQYGHFYDQIKITVGECLSMEEERIVSGSIAELSERNDFADLTVMLIENPNYQPRNKHYKDEAFTRTTVPMTKRDIRSLAVDYLDIQAENIVYDLGAGTGSVSVELASFAHKGIVYAVEKNPVAYETILLNKRKMGSYNLLPVLGNAKDEVKTLPLPDKVFIGGSSGELPEIMEVLFERNPKVEVVITAITLETLALGLEVCKKMALEYDITSVQSSYSRKLGAYNLMTGNNPIYFICAQQCLNTKEKEDVHGREA